MKLSQRALSAEPFHALAFGDQAAALEAQGHHVVRLGIGEPDFGAPPAVREAMREVMDGRPLPYTSALGLPALREAIAGFHRDRHDVDVDPARIAVTSGASCALLHHNPWELLVATILSAQCTDKRVNEVTPGLFQKYPSPQDFAAVRPEVLANDIRSTGFFNNKAKSIVGAAKAVMSQFGGKVPRTMEEMLTIPGAARKTANVVLGTAYGIASGVVVDTHVQRISQRLDLTKNADPVKIEQDLIRIIPEDRWIAFSHQVILHGRALCIARNPKCAECGLNSICYAKDKTAGPAAPVL